MGTFPIEDTLRSLTQPWADAVDSFYFASHHLKESTRLTYKKSLLRIPCTTLADFGVTSVNRHIDSKLRAGHPTIAHHDGVAAVQMAKWMTDTGLVDRYPLPGLRVPKQPLNRRQPFNETEVDAILAAAGQSQQSERDVTIMLLAFSVGMRKGEIQHAQTVDVHLRRCTCLGIKKPHILIREGKTEAATRTLPLSARAIDALDQYIADWRPSKSDGALFLNNHGDDFTDYGWSSVFRRMKSRLPKTIDFKLHRARNTALTNWSREGVDIRTVGYLAGHKRIEHTERYLGAITPTQIDGVPDAFSRTYGRKAS